MDDSAIKHIAYGTLRGLAWACFTLSAGIVVGAVAIAAVTATRPAATFEPVVVLRWEDVR